MSMIKKLIALTLALAMVLSVSAFAGYKADTYVDAATIDADCEAAVELMYALEIMKGDDKGNFRPNATITRAEMAKMIYVILNYGKDDKAANCVGANIFTDVEAGAWYEGYVNYCAATKLIAGRGDGTFAPNAPVTTAEAAKMLLTAIGYNAEHRGYVGAKWSENALSDAYALGLLSGYKANINAAAPRQWVAVMVANALDCLTFDTMKPSFDGLLTSGTATTYKTMGEKYYGIEVITAYAMATKKTTLYTDSTFSANGILFANGDGTYDLSGTGLTIADLGQEYKVILVGGKVASVRNTGKSVVAEAELRDVTAKTTTATSSNTENNKYVFTVGSFTGKLETSPAYIVLGKEAAKVAAKALTPNALYNQSNGKTGEIPVTIKVIDKDGDGLIDYAIYTEFYYADVTAADTSRAYGDYIKMENKDGANIKYNGDAKLYVDDVIDCAATLEKGDFVKYNWDHENGEFDIEVLEVVEDTLDRVTTAKQIVKIGGVEYVASEDTTAYGGYDLLVKANITKTLVAVVDGDMLVYVTTPEETTDLDGINAKLCVVTDVTDHYYTGWDKTKAVEIFTIDGEKTQYVLADQTIDTATINVVTKYDDLTKVDGGDGAYLYVYSINTSGKITLSPVAASAAGLTALDKNADVIDGYWVGTAAAWEVSDEFFGDEIILGNTYFVLENKTLSVKTLEAVEGKTADKMYWEGLYDCSTKLNAMVAGFIAVDSFSTYDDGAYLYLTDDVYSNDKTNYKADVTFANGDADTIILNHTEAEAKALELYTLYKYSVKNDKYTLTKVEADQADVKVTKTASDRYFVTEEGSAYELVEKFTGNEIYVDTGAAKLSRYDLTDCVIAIKNTIFDLDREEADVIEVSYELEFITLDELKAMDTIFNRFEENDDWYFSDFKFVAEDLFYVEVYRVTEECQEVVVVAPEAPVIDLTDGIDNADELYAFAAAAADFAGQTITLNANIDLKGAEWEPIALFNGTFDGQQYTISNFVVDGGSYAALFGKLFNYGIVKNLKVDNAKVTGSHYAAVVAAYVYGEVNNCTVTNSTVTCIDKAGEDGDKAGAVVGYISGEPTGKMIYNTVKNVAITANRDAGAIAGMVNGTVTVNGNTFEAVTFSYTGYGSGANIGGAIGRQ